MGCRKCRILCLPRCRGGAGAVQGVQEGCREVQGGAGAVQGGHGAEGGCTICTSASIISGARRCRRCRYTSGFDSALVIEFFFTAEDVQFILVHSRSPPLSWVHVLLVSYLYFSKFLVLPSYRWRLSDSSDWCSASLWIVRYANTSAHVPDRSS